MNDLKQPDSITLPLDKLHFLSKLFLNTVSRHEYVDAIVESLQQLTGCECVGMRILDSEGVMPYEAYRGFTQEFWEAENCLSIKEHQCGCIRIVTGEPDPLDREIMTPGGSLFTNDLQGFATIVPEECLSRYRCKCIESKFQSLAVVPIRYQSEVVGLIHFADSRPEILSADDLLLIEIHSSVIGEVIHRFALSEKLNVTTSEVERMNRCLEDIADSAQEWLWEVDLDGIYTFCSKRSEALLGYSPEELLGHPFSDFIVTEERAAAIEFFAGIVRRQLPFRNFENWNHHRNGSRVCLLSSGAPIFDAAGRICGYRGVDYDLTRHRQIEAELRTKERALQLAIEAGQVGLWSCQVATGVLEWNAQMKAIFGLPPDTAALTFEQFTALIHPEDVAQTTALVDAALVDAGEFRHEHRIIHPDGSVHWLLAIGRSECDATGQPLGTFGAAVDITDQKQAEADVLNQRDELLASQQLSGLGTYRWDIAADLFISSPFLDEIFGIDAAYPRTAAGWLALVHPADREEMKQHLDDVLGRKQRFDHEYRIVRPLDGEERWLHGCGELRLNADRQPVELFGTIQDISARKKAHLELTRMAQLAVVGQLAAGVAHEINNPINGVINYAQILLNRQAVADENSEILCRIIKEGGRIAGIVESLLFFSRDSGDKRGMVCAQDIIEQAQALCHSQITRCYAELDITHPATPLYVYANAQQLEQVMINLLTNACHAFTEECPPLQESRRITVELAPHSADGVEFGRFTVTDNGCGIPSQLLPEVSKPFFTTKKAGVGTGLGLGICTEIVDRHQGRWQIESSEGQFTKVTFDIPTTRLVAAS
ncbi:MAG: PAS domain-containing protein [Desulfuromonadales bacterium]|nr:PAS domain-containing protein [Desulfuromonadales bacterium]